jgi:hypothetical protein
LVPKEHVHLLSKVIQKYFGYFHNVVNW